jgi:hypothetical protein
MRMYDERRELLAEPTPEELALPRPGELDAGLWEAPELLEARASVADSKSKIGPPPGVSVASLLAEAGRLDTLYFAILAHPLRVDVAQDEQLVAIRAAETAFRIEALDPMRAVAAELSAHAGDPQVDEALARLALLDALATGPGGSVPYTASIVNNGGRAYHVTFQDRSTADAELQAAVRRGPPP